jgi:hypothetical protein
MSLKQVGQPLFDIAERQKRINKRVRCSGCAGAEVDWPNIKHMAMCPGLQVTQPLMEVMQNISQELRK